MLDSTKMSKNIWIGEFWNDRSGHGERALAKADCAWRWSQPFFFQIKLLENDFNVIFFDETESKKYAPNNPFARFCYDLLTFIS